MTRQEFDARMLLAGWTRGPTQLWRHLHNHRYRSFIWDLDKDENTSFEWLWERAEEARNDHEETA